MTTATADPLLASPAAVMAHPAAAGIPDHQLVQLLRAASSAFRGETDQHISFVADDTVTLDPEGSTVLLLPELPVVDVTAVVVDGHPITDLTGLWSDKGIIRWSTAFPRNYRSVQVTYSHGYDPVPVDVVEAVVDYVISRARSVPGAPAGTMTAGPFTWQTSSGGATELWSQTVKRYAVR